MLRFFAVRWNNGLGADLGAAVHNSTTRIFPVACRGRAIPVDEVAEARGRDLSPALN
jgi:hypothetical protein